MDIQKTYYKVSGGTTTYCSARLAFAGSVDDNYSGGTTVADPSVIIQNHLNSGDFPYDVNAIYVLLTDTQVYRSPEI